VKEYDTTDTSPSQDQSRSREIGYPFVPTPRIAIEKVLTGEIDARALVLLIVLLRWGTKYNSSCWVSIKKLSRETGKSEATVHRYLASLREAGLIRHVAVPRPDPDDPRNQTGWRFYFLWIDGVTVPESDSVDGVSKMRPLKSESLRGLKNESRRGLKNETQSESKVKSESEVNFRSSSSGEHNTSAPTNPRTREDDAGVGVEESSPTPKGIKGKTPASRGAHTAQLVPNVAATGTSTPAARTSDPQPEIEPRVDDRSRASSPSLVGFPGLMTLGSKSDTPQQSRQRDQDSVGVTCPTCRAAVVGLVFHNDDERSAIRNLVRVDVGQSTEKSYVVHASFRARISRLEADFVLEVRRDGSIVVNPPNTWAPARLRAESAERLAVIRSSAPEGVLARCTPSRDHRANNRAAAI
jgi:Helix-turn-helix domain